MITETFRAGEDQSNFSLPAAYHQMAVNSSCSGLPPAQAALSGSFAPTQPGHTYLGRGCSLSCFQVIWNLLKKKKIIWHLSNIQSKVSALVRDRDHSSLADEQWSMSPFQVW